MFVGAIVKFHADPTADGVLHRAQITPSVPLPREGEEIRLPDGRFRVDAVVHDEWDREQVSTPTIHMVVSHVDGPGDTGDSG